MAARPSPSPRRTAGCLFFLAVLGLLTLALVATPASAAACTRDTYTNLPAAPVFPTESLSSSLIPSDRPVTTGHWSEVAQYNKYRPAKITPVANPPRSACPYSDPNNELKDWHLSWDSWTPPTNGSDVTIPAATKVLISSCSIASSTMIFGTITIPAGSALVFADAPISIAAKGFNVQGQLLIGSPTCRYRNKITITLHGARNAQALPANPPVKGIAVIGGSGQADIHGVQYFTTWSRLAMTGEIGDKYVFLQDMVNWQPGQSIFITSTELKDARDWHRNEVRTVVKVYRAPSLGADVAAIELDQPLEYRHYGGREYQAEVGLLSRNIVIQGDAFHSEPTDTANAVCNDTIGSTYPCNDKYLTGFGGHVQVMGQGASGRFSGVELYRMGQTNVLGRYPLHWHLINVTDPSLNYATDCSVHHSFFRCYTIHGTHGVRLAENTAYDAIGNCFYLSENGVEENNTIQYNLGAHVHIIGNMQDASDGFWGQKLPMYQQTSSLLVPADMSAAPFYMTNMYNTIEGNAASGGWTGFSFPSLPAPIDDFKSLTDFSPANRPFRSPFRGNTAHSTGFWWGSASAFYFGGEMTYADPDTKTTLQYTEGRSDWVHDTCADRAAGTISKKNAGCPAAQQLWLELEDNKAFLANRGLQAWGNRADIVRLEIHDVALSMNVFGKVWIDQMLMECRTTGHRPTWFAGCSAARPFPQLPSKGYSACSIRDFYFFNRIGGFQWYDVGQSHIVQNSVFRNCRDDWDGCVYGSNGKKCGASAVFTSLTHSDQFVPQLMQTTSGIRYENCNNIWQSSTNRTSAVTGVTVSGRMQSWLDADGSAAGTRGRTMIGSSWANDWWKMYDDCALVNERWVCLMADKDSSAAIKFKYDPVLEAKIGTDICLNGGGNGSDPNSCPIVGTATHFGRKDESLGVPIAVMGQLTGPLIYKSGGWFVRYHKGTPNPLTIVEVQVDPKDTLLLALPYPAGTTFNITYQGGSWCSTAWAVCAHPFRSVGSVDDVYNGAGDVYYWDNSAQLLYVRVTMQAGSWPKPSPANATIAPWTAVPPAPSGVFSRGGLTLDLINYGPSIVIGASCRTNPCAPQPQVVAPAELHPFYAPPGDGDGSSAAGVQPLLSTLTKALTM